MFIFMGESTKTIIQRIKASRPQKEKLIKIPRRVTSTIFFKLKLGKIDLDITFILMKNFFIKKTTKNRIKVKNVINNIL